MADAKGETRRERNERFSIESPVPDPEDLELGDELLDLFWQLSSFRSHNSEGHPDSILPQTFIAWSESLGAGLFTDEIQVLYELDKAYRSAWFAEVKKNQEAEDDKEGDKPNG